MTLKIVMEVVFDETHNGRMWIYEGKHVNSKFLFWSAIQVFIRIIIQSMFDHRQIPFQDKINIWQTLKICQPKFEQPSSSSLIVSFHNPSSPQNQIFGPKIHKNSPQLIFFQRMSASQTHLMLLKFSIQQVKLSVRFPCALKFQLKSQNNISESRGSYELQNGVCTPDETLRMEIQIDKNENGAFQDKQVKAIVFMASVNGNIPAGSVSLALNPAHIPQQPVLISIQKCPDKSATLSYSYTLDFLRASPKSSSQSKTHSAHRRMEEQGIISSSRFRVGNGSPSYNSLKNSQKLTSSNGRGSSDQNRASISTSLYQINRDLADEDSQNRRDRASKFFEEGSQGSVRKRIDIEREKTEKMKEATLLIRQSIKKHREQRNNADEVDSVRLKEQLNQVSNLNEKLREKIKIMERKEKDQSQSLKQLRQEMERNKQKGNEEELTKLEGLQQKQRIIREYQTQVKEFEEQIGDLKINISTQNKRIQLKEVSFKDQLSRIQQKYQQSQTERQRSLVEHNKMLEQFQASQKKNQLHNKEKDRVHGEQKNKLGKKIADLNLSIISLQQKLAKQDHLLSQANSTIQMMGLQKQQQSLREKQLQEELEQKNRQIWELSEKCMEMQNELSVYEQKQKETQKQLSQTIESQGIDNHNKQSKFNQMAQTISQLQIDLLAKVQTINQLNSQISSLKQQSKATLQQNKQAKHQLQEQYREISDRFSSLAAQLDNEKASKNESLASVAAISEQFEKYKVANQHAFQVFIQEISKQYNPEITESSLEVFPAHRMNSLQTEAIQKRNTLFQNFYHEIQSLTQNLKSLESQLADQKENFTQQQQNLEKQLSEALLEKQYFSDKITMLEDRVNELTYQNEKKSIEIQENDQKIMDLKGLVNELQLEVSHCKNETKVFENDFKVQQEENFRAKNKYQSTLNAVNEESMVQIQRLRQTISEKDLKILNAEKSIEEKEQELRKLKINEQNMSLQKEQLRQLKELIAESDEEKKSWLQKEKSNKRQKQKLDNIIKALKVVNQELAQEVSQKKVELTEFSIRQQENKNMMMLLTRQLQAVKMANGNYEQQKRVMKENMVNLEMAIDEKKATIESLNIKDRQIARIKEENSIKERSYERITQDLKSQVAQYKKQSLAKTQREEEYKKKAKDLQSSLKIQMYDLQAEHKTREDTEKEKNKLTKELKGAKQQNKLLSVQFQSQRQQLNAQLQQTASQNYQLRQAIDKIQIETKNTSQRNISLLDKIRSLQEQLENGRGQWLKEKSQNKPTKTHLKQAQDQILKYQKYATELEKKNKQLTELVKRRLAEEPKSSCGDILRQVNTILLRNKAKILNKCGEREREQVVADFKQIHEKLEGAMKSYHEMK